jgi:hypothetical protein
MNQVLHIFRKDVRHLWREIAVWFALVIAFTRLLINQWNPPSSIASGPIALYEILGLSASLAPLALMFLIARAVHGEALAGDREFWTTRPYRWKKLLAAKVLFVIVFVNIPLLVAHATMLAIAGFHPFTFLGGLLWLQVVWTATFILPIAGLATVTRGIGQMFLALLFVGLFEIVFSALRGAMPNSAFPEPSTSFYFSLISIAAITVIILQYSLRRTTQSRFLIAGLAAALVVILVATPYRSLIAHAYPRQTDFPVKLSLLPARGVHYNLSDRIPLLVTFNLSGFPKDTFLELDGATLHLNNASGQHWDSRWQSGNTMIFPDFAVLQTDVELTQEALNRLKSSPMSGDLLLAVTLYHDQNQRPFVIPRGEFDMPGLGRCDTGLGTISALSCQIPIRRPAFLMLTSERISSTCPPNPNQIPPVPGQIARAYVRDGSEPAQSDLSPVQIEDITLSEPQDSTRISGMCPGTPVTLSNPEVVARTGIEVHLDSAWLETYLKALQGPHPQ